MAHKLRLAFLFFSTSIISILFFAVPSAEAQEVTEAEAPHLVASVRRLAQSARLPMPKVYVIPSETPNAFATGRNPENAAVAVTQGIMRMLNQDELDGVLAHELAHIKHRDILIGTVAATIAGAINMLYYFGLFFGGSDDEDGSPFAGLLMIIVAPIAAMLIQMAISRSREYAADRLGDLRGESKEAGEELSALVERTADPAVRGRALVILADAERSRGREREADVVLERLHREFPDLAAGVGSAP